jgi:hypothetical protein
VDKYPIVVMSTLPVQMQQRIEYRVSPLKAARRPLNSRIGSAGQGWPVRIIHSQADHHPLELGVIKKAIKTVFQNSEAAQQQVLFGTVSRHASANARGRNNSPKRRQHAGH